MNKKYVISKYQEMLDDPVIEKLKCIMERKIIEAHEKAASNCLFDNFGTYSNKFYVGLEYFMHEIIGD